MTPVAARKNTVQRPQISRPWDVAGSVGAGRQATSRTAVQAARRRDLPVIYYRE